MLCRGTRGSASGRSWSPACHALQSRRPGGCRFHTRCEFAVEECGSRDIGSVEVSPGHWARCIRVDELPSWSIETGDVPDTDPAATRDVILQVEHLDVFYGRKQVVFDVNFDLARGEVLAFVGESGSGKTTSSRAIGGLSKEWKGKVVLDGHELARGGRRFRGIREPDSSSARFARTSFSCCTRATRCTAR